MLGIGLFIYYPFSKMSLYVCSGDVVTQECVDKLIRTSNMLCPITGKTLKEKDLIPLQRGGTGYAGSGVELKATRAGAAMMA
jgi:nitric oxide synthase-interacting protein